MGEVKIIATSKDKLEPYWAAMNLQIIPNNIALIAGILCGLSVNIIKKSDKLQDISTKLVGISLFILNKIFIPIIPLFVLGFAFKLQHDEILVPILKDYSIVLINVLIPAILYLALMYYVSNDCNAKKALSSIKNMLPAFLTGLTTMSGAAAIPSSLIASEKNTKNPTLCRSIIPMTSNIHLLGDGFFIPMVSLAILTSFGYNIPDINHYLVFAFSFMLAKFAVAGVPAGGILVMLPVLKSTLGFDEEMLCLIMSIYIIFDPITTSINVLGNGGFVMMIVKCYNKIQFNFLTSK
jgi:Na+/H+-dicarboxylate symporter